MGTGCARNRLAVQQTQFLFFQGTKLSDDILAFLEFDVDMQLSSSQWNMSIRAICKPGPLKLSMCNPSSSSHVCLKEAISIEIFEYYERHNKINLDPI